MPPESLGHLTHISTLLIHASRISGALGFAFIFFGGASESMRVQLLLLLFFFNLQYCCNLIFQNENGCKMITINDITPVQEE
jgi:hypothetical protein